MTIREELTEKKSALAELKERIEANDVEAIKSGEELMTAIQSLEEQVKASEKAQVLLNSIGSKKEDNEMEEKTTFETFVEQAQSVDTSAKGWSVATHVKAATDVTMIGANIKETDKSVAAVPTAKKIADRFANITVSGNAITYFVQGEVEGSAAVTAEGAKKPQLHVPFEPKTAALKKVAAYTKETDEVLSDAPFLASAVENVLVYELDKEENSTVVGDILATSGIGAATHDGTAIGMVEKILEAKKTIASTTAYKADVVILNPADAASIKLAKDTTGNYLFGGPAADADLTIWGLPVEESSDITQGTILVAAGKNAVKIYRKGGADVKVYEQNEDDAIYNRVTIIAEERLAVAVVAPSAIVKITQ